MNMHRRLNLKNRFVLLEVEVEKYLYHSVNRLYLHHPSFNTSLSKLFLILKDFHHYSRPSPATLPCLTQACLSPPQPLIKLNLSVSRLCYHSTIEGHSFNHFLSYPVKFTFLHPHPNGFYFQYVLGQTGENVCACVSVSLCVRKDCDIMDDFI